MVAREYGFASWSALKRHVEHPAPDAFPAFPQDIDIRCELESDGRGRLLKTVAAEGAEYNYGDKFQTLNRLEDSSPERTVRLQVDPAVRALLLQHRVVAATDAYPPAHRWCRFYRGPGFGDCQSALDRA